MTRNEAVYQVMRRSRFEKIMQYIHFSDNSLLDTTDKYAKVLPFIRHLKKQTHGTFSTSEVNLSE